VSLRSPIDIVEFLEPSASDTASPTAGAHR